MGTTTHLPSPRYSESLQSLPLWPPGYGTYLYLYITLMLYSPLQIAELYDMVEKWDGVAETLPQVVERLQALSSLHEQGGYIYMSKGTHM